MFGHRSFLVLGADGASDLVSLLKSGYEVKDCEYSFQQGVDAKGRVSTRVLGGVLHISLAQLPPQPIIDWALQPKKYQDGMIVLVDAENVPLEKIFFKEATCVDMKVQYVQTGETYMSTALIIQTSRLIVGDGVTFENEWTKH